MIPTSSKQELVLPPLATVGAVDSRLHILPSVCRKLSWPDRMFLCLQVPGGAAGPPPQGCRQSGEPARQVRRHLAAAALLLLKACSCRAQCSRCGRPCGTCAMFNLPPAGHPAPSPRVNPCAGSSRPAPTCRGEASSSALWTPLERSTTFRRKSAWRELALTGLLGVVLGPGRHGRKWCA